MPGIASPTFSIRCTTLKNWERPGDEARPGEKARTGIVRLTLVVLRSACVLVASVQLTETRQGQSSNWKRPKPYRP